MIEPGRLVYRGQLGTAHRHQHAAVQITMATTESVTFTDVFGHQAEGALAVIPAGVEHTVDAGPAVGVMIYLEPTGAVARRLDVSYGGDTRHDAAAWLRTDRRALPDPAADGNLAAVADDIISRLLGVAPAMTRGQVHPVVLHAIEAIGRRLSDTVRLTDVADDVHISADRLGRLFGRDVGMSFPAYVRWVRLTRAMQFMRGGGTVTDAAHAAGFSDSAHANRVCHEMFGLSPLEVSRTVRIL